MKKLVFALFLFIAGCGTETGNPGSSPGNIGTHPSETITFLLKESICENLLRCNPIEALRQCGDIILYADNLASKLSLDISTYPTLDLVIDAEIAGLITPDEAKLIPCIDDLNSLSCGSTYMVNAFNPLNPEDFDNAYEVLNASAYCEEIY